MSDYDGTITFWLQEHHFTMYTINIRTEIIGYYILSIEFCQCNPCSTSYRPNCSWVPPALRPQENLTSNSKRRRTTIESHTCIGYLSTFVATVKYLTMACPAPMEFLTYVKTPDHSCQESDENCLRRLMEVRERETDDNGGGICPSDCSCSWWVDS